MSKKYIAAELRRQVTDRAADCCEYCRTQARYSSDRFHWIISRRAVLVGQVSLRTWRFPVRAAISIRADEFLRRTRLLTLLRRCFIRAGILGINILPGVRTSLS